MYYAIWFYKLLTCCLSNSSLKLKKNNLNQWYIMSYSPIYPSAMTVGGININKFKVKIFNIFNVTNYNFFKINIPLSELNYIKNCYNLYVYIVRLSTRSGILLSNLRCRLYKFNFVKFNNINLNYTTKPNNTSFNVYIKYLIKLDNALIIQNRYNNILDIYYVICFYKSLTCCLFNSSFKKNNLNQWYIMSYSPIYPFITSVGGIKIRKFKLKLFNVLNILQHNTCNVKIMSVNFNYIKKNYNLYIYITRFI